MSTDFATDPKVEALMEQFGGAAGMMIVVLLGRAKKEDRGGRVSATVRTLSNEAFIDRSQVPEVIAEAAKLDLLVVEHADEREIEVRFPAWGRWQDAGRKARERDHKANAKANVQSCPEVSGPVRSVSPTDRQTDRQDRDTQTEKPADAGSTPARRKPKRPDPDSLPPDFPEPLKPAVDPSLAVLRRIAAAKGSKSVERLPVARAIASFPDRAHSLEAEDLEQWWVHGKASGRPLRDVVAAFRKWLRNADPVAPGQPAPPRGRQSADQRGHDAARAWAAEAERLEALERMEAT